VSMALVATMSLQAAPGAGKFQNTFASEHQSTVWNS